MTGKPLGKHAMTPTERQRRWRAKVRRQKLFGSNRDPAALRRAPRRDDLDFWPTPHCLTTALTSWVLPTLPGGLIWEPASGDGYLVDALRAAGREVIATDIDPQRRGIARLDYLHDPPPAATRGGLMITNPPFGRSGLLDPFIARTMALLDGGHLCAAVLLQRADATGTDGRADVFNRAAAEWTCCWRPVWIPGSEPRGRWWFEWVVWRAGCAGPPTTRRLRLAELRDRQGGQP
jgi:hypothetical protein